MDLHIVTRCDKVATWSKDADGHFSPSGDIVQTSNQKSNSFSLQCLTGVNFKRSMLTFRFLTTF
jgi:hypothetical protein